MARLSHTSKEFLKEDSVEGYRFCEGHTDNGLNQNFSGCARIAPHALGCLCTYEAYPDSCTQASQGSLNTSCHFSDYFDHVSLDLFLTVFVAPNIGVLRLAGKTKKGFRV